MAVGMVVVLFPQQVWWSMCLKGYLANMMFSSLQLIFVL